MGRAIAIFILLVVGFGGTSPCRADLTSTIPADWFTRVPTPDRIHTVLNAVDVEGWSAVSDRLYTGAIKAYELRQEDAAVAWYWMARWSEVFGQTQLDAGHKWIKTLAQEGALHAGVNQKEIFKWPKTPVAELLTPETRNWLMADRGFSESFFSLVVETDCMPQMLVILQTLRMADSRRFEMYKQLALAIALVYDEPPFEGWPHQQVETTVLPRKLPKPQDAFKFLVDSDEKRLTLHRLATLSAAELKFVVDLAASFPELEWAQKNVKFSLKDLALSYDSVRYDTDRLKALKYSWPGQSYTLADIRGQGGICVDQAYFATQTSKARGVPTLLFIGAGGDSRHAWFGYLGVGNKWVLKAGASEEYVTGEAYDPQSWTPLSDHELSFLSEGFRRLPGYFQSRRHQVFAELYLKRGQTTAAATAARKAVSIERRNVDAWSLLLAANEGASAKVREPLLREAAQTLQRYPDIGVRYVRDLITSLRARGETSLADFEERGLIRRVQSMGRTDLSIDQAVAQMASARLGEEIAMYKTLMQKYGHYAQIDFSDRVTAPLVQRLIFLRRKNEAAQVIKLTRDVLMPEKGGMLDDDLTQLEKSLK